MTRFSTEYGAATATWQCRSVCDTGHNALTSDHCNRCGGRKARVELYWGFENSKQHSKLRMGETGSAKGFSRLAPPEIGSLVVEI